MESEDNVVRLPRDWLGPREELVPFGPSAEAEDDGLATPPSTHDFWGEPAMGGWEPDSAGAEPMPWRALPGRRGSAIFSRARAAVTEHRRAAAAASLISAGVLALVFALGSGGSSHHQLSAVASRSAPAQIAPAGLTADRPLPSLGSRGRHTANRRSSHATPRRVKTADKLHTVQRRSRKVTGAATAQRVRYTPPAASSSAAAANASSAPPAPPAATSASAQTAARSSGSTNQPALGAAGTLAPGSSPDS